MMNEAQPYRSDAAAMVRGYRQIEALIPPHWQADTVFANGIRHHYYRTGGDKPPLLLLHGFLEGALTWLRTARALEPEYDIIMVDARGHGGADRATTGFSQALLVEDAAGVIRALQLGASRVIGHSQGGATGIHLAAAYPELVHSLIVEGWGDDGHQSGDFASSPAYQAWFNGYLAWLERLKTQTHAERMSGALTQLPPGAPALPEDEYVPWVENCARLDLDLVRLSVTMWSAVAEQRREMIEALGRTTCPVLIMKSSFFPQPGGLQSIQEESSDQPSVTIVRFENTGHLIHRDQLEQFVTVAKGFFDQHKRR